MGKYALIFLLLLFPANAFGHDFLFSWGDPTQRTNGTALNPDTEIQSYRMRCEGPENAERIVDRSATSSTGTNARQYNWADAVSTSGVYQCKMTAIDTGERESDWSNIAGVEKYAPPAPPTDFRRGM
jgi:hypothetical protein